MSAVHEMSRAGQTTLCGLGLLNVPRIDSMVTYRLGEYVTCPGCIVMRRPTDDCGMNVRASVELVQRAELLAPVVTRINGDRTWTADEVLQVALLRGLEDMEKTYAKRTKS